VIAEARTDEIVTRARDFITFCDGLEQSGLAETARRGRVVARDVLDLANELGSTRSALDAMRRRLDDYVAYHRAHCFEPDGSTRSGVGVAPFIGEERP
jgi:hypothetical protein